MKKFLLIIVILIFSITLAILFNPRSAEGARTVTLRIDAQDIREVWYYVYIKKVSLDLKREIQGMTRLDFINIVNRREALMLMDMLTSNKGVLVNVEAENGIVSDFGFSSKAK